MTREQSIKELEEMIKYEWGTYQTKTARTYVEALDMAIKALEQEPALDKIRAEIGNINLNEVAEKYEDRFYGFQREVIKIIDKYKGESEDK